jgi:pimeloyl-ACP methyl ester carboxylesterase
MEISLPPPPRRLRAAAGALLVIGGAFFMLRPAAVDARSGDPRAALTPCHIKHLAEEVKCGSLDVFENRESRTGRRLRIQFAVLEPLRRAKDPDPLFILSGGPGQGARDFGAVAARFFKKVRRTREIVLVDLRGTGASNPLRCHGDEDALAALTSLLGTAASAGDCLKTLDADPRLYTHREALADLDDIRRMLGYDKINLWGGSWGTRASLLYAARFPTSVRTVVLDGAVPLDMGFPISVASDSEHALDLLIESCRGDSECAAAFPAAKEELQALLDRLAARPEVRTIRHPRTGRPVDIRVTREALAEISRVALYTPTEAARLLRILQRAGRGDFEPLAAQLLRSASMSTDEMSLGATLSILCSEDVPRFDRERMRKESAGTFVSTSYADAFVERCGTWPAGAGIDVPANVRLDTPALILSGEHDPVTPPRWGVAMGRHFPNHRHVVVPGAAHNTSFTGCVPDLIARFIERGEAAALDVSCAAKATWPLIAVSDAGSRS